jgi:hypothetical protein
MFSSLYGATRHGREARKLPHGATTVDGKRAEQPTAIADRK